MSRYLTALALLCLTACSEVGPFVDARREAGLPQPVGQSRPNRIAVCYNPLWHSEEKVAQLAIDACAEQKKTATYEETRYFNCRLFTPNTAFYACE